MAKKTSTKALQPVSQEGDLPQSVHAPLQLAIMHAQNRCREIATTISMLDILHVEADALDEIDLGDVLAILKTITEILSEHLETIENLANPCRIHRDTTNGIAAQEI